MVKNMPMFLAEHSWVKEKTPAMMKGIVDFLLQLEAGVRPEGVPETVTLCAVYTMPGERAICIWEADHTETLEKMFVALLEILPAKTVVTPMLQAYPPGPGLYAIMSQMM
jgi:hypothetical protein